jgi:hypothetical protein
MAQTFLTVRSVMYFMLKLSGVNGFQDVRSIIQEQGDIVVLLWADDTTICTRHISYLSQCYQPW